MADNPTLRHGDETGDGWVEYLQEVLNFTDGRDPHTFVQEGNHATVLYCANTGSTTLEARSHTANCELSSPVATR
jgi:hypothetical protein